MVRADKGKKRKKYDMTLRMQKKEFADLKRTLEESQRPQRERVVLSSAQRKRKKRAELIPTNKTCGVCGEVKLKRRQWVCKNHVVMCKSCWMKGKHNG